MTSWLTENIGLPGDPGTSLDERVDRQLRGMDIALALLALALLVVPMAIGLLVGRLSSDTYLGCDNQVFKRWRIDLCDTFMGRLFDSIGMSHWPVLFNILQGQMAWVGHTAIAANSYEDYHPALIRVRPGLISIWAMRRRTAVDFGSELDANLEYLRRRGLRHDFALLLRSLLVVWMPSPREASAGRICVGDVSFDNVNMEQAVARISKMLEGTRAQQVSFVNPACVNIAAHDRGYRRLLARAEMVLPDGIGIKIAADLLGVPLKQNVNGTDLFPRLCEMFERRGVSIFLLGGQPGVAERVAEVIGQRWPDLRIVGVRDGFFSVAQEGEVAAEVSASWADVVLVARGVPMQDVFIDRHLHQLGVKVAIGVGGLFDFVSGRINRAPLWMRDSGLEWIYRLMQEPSRMWRRYLVGNFTFLGRIVLQRLGLRSPAGDDFVEERSVEPAVMGGTGGLRTVLFATSTAPNEVPVPNDFPSALLPFGWTTFVERAIEQLANHGVRHIDLVVSSRPEELRRVLGQGERWGVQLRWHLAKNSATPYGLLRSMGLPNRQRVLLGHADRLVNDATLSSLIEEDQMAATVHEQTGMAWAGWGSTTAELLRAPAQHSDECVMGAFLCQQATQLHLLDPSEFVAVANAGQLLNAQHLAMTNEALERVPATWLRTAWGAHSPDATIHPGAVIEGPVLIGPGCFVAAGASLGPGTVLTHDVVISSGATVGNSLVLPQTFVGQGLELDEAVVNGCSVQHLRLGVRTTLPRSDGLLLDLQPVGVVRAGWFSRFIAAVVCLAFLPWLVIDSGLRRLRGLPLRWNKRLVAMGRSTDTGEIQLQTLRCARSTGYGTRQILSHYGEWMDVVAGHRSWFGSRPRSQSEWYALGRDWQLVLASTTVGCLHAPAWSEGSGESLESRAAADVFYAVSQSFVARVRIARSVFLGALSSGPQVA
jgi:N-acetylglucosaminyldiphosphoundecaprenol N-acetyl-beta-D-mannosaminyltransferase